MFSFDDVIMATVYSSTDRNTFLLFFIVYRWHTVEHILQVGDISSSKKKLELDL